MVMTERGRWGGGMYFFQIMGVLLCGSVCGSAWSNDKPCTSLVGKSVTRKTLFVVAECRLAVGKQCGAAWFEVGASALICT